MPTKNKKTKTIIKAIAFDYGDVLVQDQELVLEAKYKLRYKSKAQRKKYHDYLDKTERNHGSIKKLANIAKEVFGYPGPASEISEYIIKAPLIKPMWRLAQKLRKHYQVAILTNNKKNWPQTTAKRMGFSLKGIKIINSADIGLRKPEPAIYRYMLKVLKVRPNELVFIDDKRKNITGAKRAGIHALWFNKNFPKILSALKKLGIAVRI